MVARVKSSIRALFRRRRVDREMEDEWQFHLEKLVTALIREGVPPDEARRRAKLEFGNPVGMRDEARDARGLRLVDEFWGDLRYASRRLFVHDFSAVSIVVAGLALAIAVNVLAFTFVNATALRPPGVSDRSSAVRLRKVTPSLTTEWMTFADFSQLRDRAQLLQVEASIWDGTTVADPTGVLAADPRVRVKIVSGRLFQTFGMSTTVGRSLAATDDLVGAPPVAVLSYGYWVQRFGGDRGVIGRTVLLSETPVTVVGVTDRASTGPFVPTPPAVWLPLGTAPVVHPYHGTFTPTSQQKVGVVARLASAPPAAEAEATSILKSLVPVSPGTQQDDVRVLVADLSGASSERFLQVGLVMGLVGLVLVLGCTNAANFLLASASVRQHEIATRRALGASPRRIARQLLTEGLVVGSAGGVLGLLLAIWTLPAFVGLVSGRNMLPPGFDIYIDWRVYLFTLAVSILGSLLAGLTAARHGARHSLTYALKAGGAGRGSRHDRLRSLFIGLQATTSIVILVLGVALGRSLLSSTTRDYGFEIDRIAAVTVPMQKNDPGGQRAKDFVDDVVTRAESFSGIEHTALSEFSPFESSSRTQRLALKAGGVLVREHRVTGSYFATLGIRFKSGVAFADEAGDRGELVAVVDEKLVRATGTSLGDLLHLNSMPGVSPPDVRTLQVVGIVDTATFDARPNATAGSVYLPLPPGNSSRILVRTVENADSASVRGAIAAVDPSITFRWVQATQALDDQLGPLRVLVTIAAVVGAIALGLAVAGVFAITSFVTVQRLPEVMIRLAVGATRKQVVALLIFGGLRPVLIGLLVGLAIAFPGMWVIAKVFYGVRAADPVAIATAVTVLVGASVCAAVIPAVRASRLDPAQLFREA